MKFINNSKYFVRVVIHDAFPPTEDNTVGKLTDYGPGTDPTIELKPGDYHVRIFTTNIGTVPPGILIAATGGVPSEGSVTLTENDRISVT